MPSQYHKPFLAISDQLAKLKERGLNIPDENDAKERLEEYGYYRLSGYWHPLRKYDLATGKHLDEFRENACLSSVIALIEFDRSLRSLFMNAADRIEIAVRVQVALLLGQRSPWAHRNPAEFYTKFTAQVDHRTGKIPYNDWVARLDEREAQSKESFARHFRTEYLDPPPVWVSVELWDFGMLSKLIGGMTNDDLQHLADVYQLQQRRFLPSWLRSINHVRNIAAHHSRLWNRSPADQPVIPVQGMIPYLDHLADDNFAKTRLYAVAAVTQILLRQVNVEAAARWSGDLQALCAAFPEIDGVPLSQSGFPKGWEELPLWSQF